MYDKDRYPAHVRSTKQPDERPSKAVKRTKRYADALRALAMRFRELRISRGLTQEQVAERADVDTTHVQKVEAAAVNVTMATLVRLAAGLDVPLRVLFDPAEEDVAGRRVRRLTRQPMKRTRR